MTIKNSRATKNYITTVYKGITIEIAEDGTWFDAYEETSIFKLRASVTSGATTKQNYYSLDYVKNQVDDLLNHLEA